MKKLLFAIAALSFSSGLFAAKEICYEIHNDSNKTVIVKFPPSDVTSEVPANTKTVAYVQGAVSKITAGVRGDSRNKPVVRPFGIGGNKDKNKMVIIKDTSDKSYIYIPKDKDGVYSIDTCRK